MSGATPRQRRVLLVEDDALSLKLMKDVLEANGYQVEQATNGLDGLRADP